MSFALFIESDGRLIATVFDGQNWIAVDSGTKTVSPNEWSSVMFEYDGVSIASLSLNDAVVGSRLDMPVGIRAPQQVISMGHWPRGDGRYTFVGDLGPIRIEKRDVDDFMQDAWATALCRRRLTAEQANAINELVALTEAMDPAEVARLRACAQAQSQRIRELLHELRTFNPRHLVYLRTLGDRLRSAWCCSFDRVAARSALLDYFRLVSGGDPADARLRAWIEEFLDLADMCTFSGKEYDRVRELGAILFPELASYEADLRDIADSV